jgi:hypothetical protein
MNNSKKNKKKDNNNNDKAIIRAVGAALAGRKAKNLQFLVEFLPLRRQFCDGSIVSSGKVPIK